MTKQENRSLGEHSTWEIFKYLLSIGDYAAALGCLFMVRPSFWTPSILYTNGKLDIKRFKYRSDAIAYVVNEGDRVANYAIYSNLTLEEISDE